MTTDTYSRRLRRARSVALDNHRLEGGGVAPCDQHGPIMTAMHWRIAQTDPRHCTADELDDLAAALEAAGRRLDARDADLPTRRGDRRRSR